ncbi:hypothetical protein [Pararhodobacter sp. CCB-MM2]|uniref:hypothetical protein n=1 Tax=Pararhodobacter sp. CCB-MM2 TaxID=1786003 RepID=UPI0011129F96|nr:hypothetical protein [Pararhodobacter sp. CCB-MM2]
MRAGLRHAVDGVPYEAGCNGLRFGYGAADRQSHQGEVALFAAHRAAQMMPKLSGKYLFYNNSSLGLEALRLRHPPSSLNDLGRWIAFKSMDVYAYSRSLIALGSVRSVVWAVARPMGFVAGRRSEAWGPLSHSGSGCADDVGDVGRLEAIDEGGPYEDFGVLASGALAATRSPKDLRPRIFAATLLRG